MNSIGRLKMILIRLYKLLLYNILRIKGCPLKVLTCGAWNNKMGKNPMVINNLKSYKNLLLTPWTLTIIQYDVMTPHLTNCP